MILKRNIIIILACISVNWLVVVSTRRCLSVKNKFTKINPKGMVICRKKVNPSKTFNGVTDGSHTTAHVTELLSDGKEGIRQLYRVDVYVSKSNNVVDVHSEPTSSKIPTSQDLRIFKKSLCGQNKSTSIYRFPDFFDENNRNYLKSLIIKIITVNGSSFIKSINSEKEENDKGKKSKIQLIFLESPIDSSAPTVDSLLTTVSPNETIITTNNPLEIPPSTQSPSTQSPFTIQSTEIPDQPNPIQHQQSNLDTAHTTKHPRKTTRNQPKKILKNLKESSTPSNPTLTPLPVPLKDLSEKPTRPATNPGLGKAALQNKQNLVESIIRSRRSNVVDKFTTFYMEEEKKTDKKSFVPMQPQFFQNYDSIGYVYPQQSYISVPTNTYRNPQLSADGNVISFYPGTTGSHFYNHNNNNGDSPLSSINPASTSTNVNNSGRKYKPNILSATKSSNNIKKKVGKKVEASFPKPSKTTKNTRQLRKNPKHHWSSSVEVKKNPRRIHTQNSMNAPKSSKYSRRKSGKKKKNGYQIGLLPYDYKPSLPTKKPKIIPTSYTGNDGNPTGSVEDEDHEKKQKEIIDQDLEKQPEGKDIRLSNSKGHPEDSNQKLQRKKYPLRAQHPSRHVKTPTSHITTHTTPQAYHDSRDVLESLGNKEHHLFQNNPGTKNEHPIDTDKEQRYDEQNSPENNEERVESDAEKSENYENHPGNENEFSDNTEQNENEQNNSEKDDEYPEVDTERPESDTECPESDRGRLENHKVQPSANKLSEKEECGNNENLASDSEDTKHDATAPLPGETSDDVGDDVGDQKDKNDNDGIDDIVTEPNDATHPSEMSDNNIDATTDEGEISDDNRGIQSGPELANASSVKSKPEEEEEEEEEEGSTIKSEDDFSITDDVGIAATTKETKEKLLNTRNSFDIRPNDLMEFLYTLYYMTEQDRFSFEEMLGPCNWE